jgi:hypothetical protein
VFANRERYKKAFYHAASQKSVALDINAFRKSCIHTPYIYMLLFKTENGSPGNFFLNLFTVCSMCKRKFVVCLFVDKETNRSYPLANGLNGLNGLNRVARLCVCVYVYVISSEFWLMDRYYLLNVNDGLMAFSLTRFYYRLSILSIKIKKIFYRWIDTTGGQHDQ